MEKLAVFYVLFEKYASHYALVVTAVKADRTRCADKHKQYSHLDSIYQIKMNVHVRAVPRSHYCCRGRL